MTTNKEAANARKELRKVLIEERRIRDRNKDVRTTVWFIRTLPEGQVPQKEACLLQDYWHTAGEPYVAEECDVV
jgi:hypothetical protein